MVIKNAFMLRIGNRNWFIPKNVLVEISGSINSTEDGARKAFEKYQKEYRGDNYLIDYTYIGDVEVL